MTWQLRQADLATPDPDVLSALFAVGNGATTTRGTLGEERFGAFRGVFVSGLHGRAPQGLMYTLGAPDWLPAWVEIDGRAAACTRSERTLDLKTGVLAREAEFAAGTTTVALREERLASLAEPDRMAQRVEAKVTAGEAPVAVVLGLDGEIRQSLAKYYRPGQYPICSEEGLKLAELETIAAEDGRLHVELVSRPTGRKVSAAAVVRQTGGPECGPAAGVEDNRALVRYRLPAGAGRVVFEKLVSLATDAETALPDEPEADRLGDATFDAVREASQAAWLTFWDGADVRIDGDPAAQLAVRYALWSTRIAAPLDGGASSIGAKNLTGDWYRGAVFWDLEMYQFALLAAAAPERARNHLLYRARRLPAAQRLAAQDGYDGARFPFQSYDTGLEDPPVVGPRTAHQLHLDSAVMWVFLLYERMTGDTAFMLETGLEVVAEVAAFFASRAEPEPDGYHIRGICGPDEIHKGVDDNAYTNRFVAEMLREADRLVARLEETDADRVRAVLDRCGIDGAARAAWRQVADRLHVPMLAGGVYEQFAGWGDLPEPDWKLRQNTGPGCDKRHKQADALMLWQAIPEAVGWAAAEPNFREHAPLCEQTSSLSLATHALLAARLGLGRDARRYFASTAGVDLEDAFGNTAHGVHGAGEGGLWMAAVWGFGGLAVGPEGVRIDPKLPPWWTGMAYRFHLQGQVLAVEVGRDRMVVQHHGDRPVALEVLGEWHTLKPGATLEAAHATAWRDQGLEGVIFDLDGVLVRTDRHHYLAWKELADDLGIPFDEEKNHALRGVSREESLRRIYGDLALPPPAEFEAQCARKNARYREMLAEMGPDDVLAGSVELLAALRAAGVKCAVSSASKNTPLVLERTGLGAHLDAVVDGNCVSASKPDPQGFLLSSQRLRCLPWACIGVEDAASGIEAIRRAGMASVGIGEPASEADLVVGGVNELTVGDLQALYERVENPVNPYLERNVRKMKHEMAG